MPPTWLVVLGALVGGCAIWCGVLLIRDCWAAYLAGLAQERQLARLREREAERRRQHRVDGRLDRREP